MGKVLKKYSLLGLAAGLLLIIGNRSLLRASEESSSTNLTISVDANKVSGTLNPMLMGFNTIYCHEKDELWKGGTGPLPTALKSLDTRILRYPGGTVTTFYHWEAPTGQGWADSWSDNFNATKNLPSTEW
ncbi:MAG TPA: hypothetical protein PKA53_14065, partial [Sphingobacterium sp.]|nr:hypothetical protein [Sphingobacterium sp.]